MTLFKTKVDIKRPVEQVYAAFVDWAQAICWRGGLTSVKIVNGKHGKHGSKHRLTFNRNGREITFDETVIDMVENEACYFRADHERMYSLANVIFRESDGKTHVTSSVHAHGYGLLWRFLVPFMKGNLRRRQQADFMRFKAHLEKSP
jgi:uncharacterized membrane protein